jgi:hypothetical protein
MLVTVKLASTFTVTRVPSAFVMCASYGEPSGRTPGSGSGAATAGRR